MIESEDNRKKILNLVNQLDDKELAKVSELLGQPNEEAQPEMEEPVPVQNEDQESLTPSCMTGVTHKSMISGLQKQL